MRTITGLRLSCAALLPCLAAAGCGDGGPDLARVSGTVTLDGRALPNAIVEFIPESGRSSVGFTDEQGRYELAYSQDRKGAVLGRHRVRISTHRPKDIDWQDDERQPTPAIPEQVPAVYNRQSTLTREVRSGRQQIDFALDSNPGPIIP